MIDVAADAAVSFPVEGAAVPQVRAAGEDEEGAGGIPGFFDYDIAGDGDYGVCGGKEAAEGVEAVADGFGCTAVAFKIVNENAKPL